MEQSLMCTCSLRDREEKGRQREDELNETLYNGSQWNNCPRTFAGSQIPFSCLTYKNKKKPTQVISLIWLPFFLVWNFLTFPRLFLFLFCAAPFEMLPWIYIFTGLLLVINTHCKLELTWMVSTHSSFCLWGIHSYVSDMAYSSGRFYTWST